MFQKFCQVRVYRMCVQLKALTLNARKGGGGVMNGSGAFTVLMIRY